MADLQESILGTVPEVSSQKRPAKSSDLPQKRVRLDLRSHGAMLHKRSRTKGHHACAIRPLSHGTSVNKQGSFHTREWTRFRAKNYASVRFCRRSRPTTKFLNVCENFARNVGHVKHYCPFTRSSFCNISQTLRTFRKECWFFFRRVKRALHTIKMIDMNTKKKEN